jgi:hypothetical protein
MQSRVRPRVCGPSASLALLRVCDHVYGRVTAQGCRSSVCMCVAAGAWATHQHTAHTSLAPMPVQCYAQ